MNDQERRRHVRIKPAPDLPARVVVDGGLVREVADVVDVSVGGLALAADGPLARSETGAEVRLRVDLGSFGEHAVLGRVRWRSPATVGVELVEPDVATTLAIGRYVAELLARGAAS